MTEAPITLEYVKTILDAQRKRQNLSPSKARDNVREQNPSASPNSGLIWDLLREGDSSCLPCLSKSPEGFIIISPPYNRALLHCAGCRLNTNCPGNQNILPTTVGIHTWNPDLINARVEWKKKTWPALQWYSQEDAYNESENIFDTLNKWIIDNPFGIRNVIVHGSFAIQQRSMNGWNSGSTAHSAFIHDRSDIDLILVTHERLNDYWKQIVISGTTSQLFDMTGRKIDLRLLDDCQTIRDIEYFIRLMFRDEVEKGLSGVSLNIIPIFESDFKERLRNTAS